jgi:demethylmenaquinone methyltransferase / 2-methoxy-6-polyprenyl-1,4-benzoquinol methylase
MRALPALARAVSSSPDSYVYLAESIRAWPDQAELAARIAAAGWARVAWRNLTGGIVALHRATRPA